MNNDYARHVRRKWVDTHSQNIRTDPEIYLTGEINADAKDSDSDDSDSDDSDSDDSDSDDSDSDDSDSDDSARDDSRPNLTLIDAPVGESVLSHPYGRHSCLYMEVKVEANMKPNPQEVVCPLFLGVPHY